MLSSLVGFLARSLSVWTVLLKANYRLFKQVRLETTHMGPMHRISTPTAVNIDSPFSSPPPHPFRWPAPVSPSMYHILFHLISHPQPQSPASSMTWDRLSNDMRIYMRIYILAPLPEAHTFLFCLLKKQLGN
ncbi:hypothetical protein BJ322DRAFT_5456 [Thelephora terrestris]|uniref:Uncharacterized protein n=1 Tax=Thelephora terrestris TaxID=56493 RepID=A0A9P6LC59_9AGAM|nr:hypothetical protein BJ322DRAFT_5456 [Thelephora terrestris]